MKFETFDGSFSCMPVCCENMKKAIIRIGEINPYNIRRNSLKKYSNKKRKGKPNFFKVGILNIRKALNRNLGSSGKYSNRMISELSKIRHRGYENGMLSVKIPGKDFYKIVEKVNKLLYDYDSEYFTSLLDIELKDQYSPKLNIENCVFRAVIPINSNIIMRSSPKTKRGQEIRDLIY